MDTPISMQIICPQCKEGSSLPGFLYRPDESISCYHCGAEFLLKDSQVRQMVKMKPHGQLLHLRDPDSEVRTA